MLRIFAILICILLAPLQGLAETANSSSLQDGFVIKYVDDSNNPLNLSQIQLLPLGMYADLKQGIHKPESLDFSVWYRLEFDVNFGDVNQPFAITVDNPTLDYIHFYLVEGENVVAEKIVGDTQRTDSELDHVVPQFNLYEGMNRNQKVYIHIKTNGASASPITIEYAADANLRNSAQLLLVGCFVGVVLIMVIYNFFMYRGVKDPSFINYIGYIFFAGLTLSLINGFTFYWLPFELATWLNNHLMLSHFCGLAFAIKFANSFLRFDTVKIWFVNLGEFLAKLNFLFALSALFLTEAVLTPIYFVSVVSIYVYCISLLMMVLNSRKLWVRYYLMSWLPLFVGVGVGIAAFNGGVAYNFLTRNGALLGVLAEICIMAIALMDRFRANEIEKEFKLHHDDVTGLPNHVALKRVIEKLTLTRNAFTLVLFEVPELKERIPSLGVKIANGFVQELARNIEKYSEALSGSYEFEKNLDNIKHRVVRVNDFQFAIVFVGEISDESMTYNMLSIQEAVSTPIEVNGAFIKISCFGGVVSYPNDSVDSKNLIALAYQALMSGRKLEHGWDRHIPQQSHVTQKRFKLAADLQHAIDADDLELHHQPQVDMATGQIVGSEVLLRWQHNEFGDMDTSEVIEIAEETGIINQLTEWVISKGFSQHEKLRRLGFEHTIAINISMKDLSDNGLIAHILTTTAEFNFTPSSIIFEISERAIMLEPELTKKIVTELYQQGYKIAIDDYGTSFSSDLYLTQLPFHQLKIDKSFMDINSSENNRTIAEITIETARRLGVEAVAEGIEYKDVEEILKLNRCHKGQGFLYAKPMSFLEYMRWLQGKGKMNKAS